MPKRKTTEEFKAELKQIFPNLELISEYKNDNVTVRCTIHDYTFNSKPVWLRHGHGCQKCYDDRRGDKTRNNLDDIISRAKEVHKDKYIYSKILTYKNGHTKVPIICPIHGEFQMTMNHHTSGQGCPKCAGKYKTTEEIINEFKKVHKDDSIYDKVVYEGRFKKVCIICPIHGEFWQTPDKHLQGEGCPICKSSKLERNVRNFLIENNIEFERQKTFNWLGRQSLDFYLPKYNIAIECQGEQHFKEFTGTIVPKNNIDKRIIMDITKNELCNENNVRLLYVMPKRWKDKSFAKKFNGIYTNENTILEKELNIIKARLID